jgi:uncharacterized protein (TIGR02217 family)
MASAAPTIWRPSSPSSKRATGGCTASASRIGATTSPACLQARQGPIDQAIGTGDGTTTAFQLVKRYASGSQTWTRAIAKPVAGTVRIALGGVEQPSGWSVDTTTGIVTFSTAPSSGVAITAGFEFDVPVRFDTDALDVTLDLERLGSITSIPLLEIRR